MGKKSRRGRPPKAERQRATVGNASSNAADRQRATAGNADPNAAVGAIGVVSEEDLYEVFSEEALEKYIMPMIRNAEKNGLGVDDLFLHNHTVSACDIPGNFVLLSHFIFQEKVSFLPPSLSVFSVISTHDGLIHATIASSHICDDGETKTMMKELGEKEIRFLISYNNCFNLLSDYLHRMKSCKKVLCTTCEKVLVRLYGLGSSKGETEVLLPQPFPAPSVDSLWCLLHRKEYEEWVLKANSINGASTYTPESFEEALNQVALVHGQGTRLAASLNHMALCHTLSGETKEASWLLWEAKALGSAPSDVQPLAECLESSAVVQTLLNKSFAHVATAVASSTAPQIPEGVVFTAQVALATIASSEEKAPMPVPSIAKASRLLTKAGCAVCGAQACPNGDKLMECSRCRKVLFCGREHQRWHWKNGHKEECKVHMAPIDVLSLGTTLRDSL